jgi:hypothetical protein
VWVKMLIEVYLKKRIVYLRVIEACQRPGYLSYAVVVLKSVYHGYRMSL